MWRILLWLYINSCLSMCLLLSYFRPSDCPSVFRMVILACQNKGRGGVGIFTNDVGWAKEEGVVGWETPHLDPPLILTWLRTSMALNDILSTLLRDKQQKKGWQVLYATSFIPNDTESNQSESSCPSQPVRSTEKYPFRSLAHRTSETSIPGLD